MTLRIMSHNILEGFSAKDGSVDTNRLDAARAVVLRMAPDVLVLNEALHCAATSPQRRDYAAWFDMPHCASVSYDDDWGNVVLSRRPIESVREFAIHNRAGLAVQVRSVSSLLSVATYHPHPSRWPEHKAEDFLHLIEGVDGPCVVCGDFNAINPEDEPNLDHLTAAFRAFTPEGRERWSAARFVEGGQAVFAALAKVGFHDALTPSMRGPTTPTRLIASNDDSAMRIDHIVANRAVNVVNGGVVRGPDADAASDHYPVWADVLPTAA